MQRRDTNLLTIARITFFVAILAAVEAFGQVPPPPTPDNNGPAPVLNQSIGGGFSGSVPSGQASPTPLALSLRDAIQRGLKYNLGVLTNQDSVDLASAQRRRALSYLLPNLSAGAIQTSQQLDLVAFGLNLPGCPTLVGPAIRM
jgi:hypothetical protein